MKKNLHQVGYLQRLYREARSTDHKKTEDLLYKVPVRISKTRKICCHWKDISLNVAKGNSNSLL